MNLLELVKKQKWKEVLIEIEKPDIEINIKDESGNYLIHFIILSNQIEILNELLKKNVQLNILDFEGRSILYLPIKLRNDKIIEIILEYDKTSIGIDLIDFQDRHNNIPLHYAILFNNKFALELLLKYNSDINTIDRNQNNALHLSIKSKQLDICKILFNYIKKKTYILNYQNKNGETILHIACNLELIEIIKLILEHPNIDVNIQDFDYQLTPVMYAIYLNNQIIIDLLIKYHINVNKADYQGNTPLHHCILENQYKSYQKLIHLYTNFDITNINGETLLHLILTNPIIYLNKNILKEYNIELLIKNTNLNIQDNKGNTPLHYLCKLNMWNLYSLKNINIFVTNIEMKSPLDYTSDKEKLIDIVTKNYIQILQTSNEQWKNPIDNKCKKLKNYDKCYDTIKKFILKNKISFPMKMKHFIFFENKKNINFTTFTGISLDVICGLIYLKQKYKCCISLTKDFIRNKKLEEFYKQNGILKSFEYNNFEISWVFKHLFIPNNMFDLIRNCKQKTFIIPIGIELLNGSHSNILIIHKNDQEYEIERFEPNGYDFPFDFNYNPDLLDSLIIEQFKNNDFNFKYYRPIDYLPKIGFQLLESNEHIIHKKIGDPSGFCAAWSLWWTDYRIKHSDIDRKELVIKLINSIKLKNISFKNLIRNYSQNITKFRDNILKKLNLTINNIVNDNITEEQFNNINNYIISNYL